MDAKAFGTGYKAYRSIRRLEERIQLSACICDHAARNCHGDGCKGGNVMRGGSAVVGERGPELLNLPRGAQVSPLDGNGGGMTINFNGPIYSVDDFDEAVNKARLRFRRAGN